MRDYGAGSIQKRNGKWRGVLRFKREDGSWGTETKVFDVPCDESTNKGVREAKKLLTEWRAECVQEHACIDCDASVSVYAYVCSYVESRAPVVERSTLCEYRRLAKYLWKGEPIAEICLSELIPPDVQNWVNSLSEDYKPVTVRKAFVLLRSAMSQAVERDILAKNPTRTVAPPKQPSLEPNSLSNEQREKLLAFLDLTEPSEFTLGIKMALLTGMRESEICGLRWRDVDLNACTLQVRNVIGRDEDGEYLKEPKTGGSRREVFFGRVLQDSLMQREQAMRTACSVLKLDFFDGLFVLGDVSGGWLPRHVLWRYWNTCAKSLGLVGTQGKRPTFHDLRHSYATTAISSGVDVRTVASSMGHSNIAMTLNTYTSADPDAKRRAAMRVEDAMITSRAT